MSQAVGAMDHDPDRREPRRPEKLDDPLPAPGPGCLV